MLFLYLLFLQTLISASSGYNLTNWMMLRRKRSLIYEGGGFIQFSAAGIWPASFDDGTKFKLLNCIAVLQSTYMLPNSPLSSWNNWLLRESRRIRTNREEFDKTGYCKEDQYRTLIYKIVEEFMNRNRRNGRECLLRSICENAQVDEHNDVYSRILDVVLTPSLGRDCLNGVYQEAMEAGRFGVDCFKTYSLCPYGYSLLDQITVII